MTISEQLDIVAGLARDGHHVAVVASGTHERETIRKGLRRRLNAWELERVWLATSVSEAASAPNVVRMLLTDGARGMASAEDLAIASAYMAPEQAGADRAAE